MSEAMNSQAAEAYNARAGWVHREERLEGSAMYVRIDAGPNHESALLCIDDGEPDCNDIARFHSIATAEAFVGAWRMYITPLFPTPPTVAEGEWAVPETLADEFKRLMVEFEFGERQNRNEAWNLIAEFAFDNFTVIHRLLSEYETRRHPTTGGEE